MRQWCEDILENLHLNHDELRETNNSVTLDELKEKFIQFQEELSGEDPIEINEIYEQANELYLQLEDHFERNDYNISDKTDRIQNQADHVVPIGGHILPPLPYRYDALQPYIDKEIMRIHHDKHHKSYVEGLNKAEKEMEKARSSNNFDLIKHWEREAAFNGAGHYLHTIFWTIMSPSGGGQPSGMLLQQINQSFGSFEKFKKHFTEAANNVEGGGWAILVWSPRSRRLEILQAEKHQNLSQWDVVPILVLDVWEHAYYLQYKNERKKYIDNWWKIVNWKEAERRYNEAQKLKWQPL
ncbi:superoxide dismutase [Metabacillus sediminilitoris]|uniref:superoxide dismutase n=2 Tax=Metabacillus sediminilitoris TaxID=2567941 RepID=A0A4S4BL83_9BACI|nr:superoxide dismutase [Metabacillus sediminilitoris]THF75319.1 superoxide dismutase [Metabacillus sediminilitoris]